MERRIENIIELANGEKYFVYKQAVYKKDNYFAVISVSENEKELTSKYKILHEIVQDASTYVEEVADHKLFDLIGKYLGILEK